jgi:uncharacterized surface protein with fasciclin (FAS1) repeats
MKYRIILPASIAVGLLAACAADPDTPQQPVTQEVAVESAASEEMKPVPMAYEEPVVGGAKMAVGRDIMANLSNSKEHTILVLAFKAAGMDEVLQGPGPLTVFAPTNAAFERIPGGYQQLLQPGNGDQLVRLLSYHIVPEKLDDMTLANRVMAGNGTALLTTVEGTPLKATVGDGAAIIVDARDGAARITVPNVLQSNGVVQVIDKVLMH